MSGLEGIVEGVVEDLLQELDPEEKAYTSDEAMVMRTKLQEELQDAIDSFCTELREKFERLENNG